MDYVKKINAAILAFTTLDKTDVGAVKEGVVKQLLLDDNDVFMDLVAFYEDETLSAEGMQKPEVFRAEDIRDRLTNFVQLRAAIKEAKGEKKQLSAQAINFILRRVDEDEWNMYYNILSKKQGLLFTAEPIEELVIEPSVVKRHPKQVSRKPINKPKNK